MSMQPLFHAIEETSESHDRTAIAREARNRLRNSGYGSLDEISCLSDDGVLYLHGCLPSHYLKQVAQEVVSGTAGVCQVINRIMVSRPGRRTRPGRPTIADPSI